MRIFFQWDFFSDYLMACWLLIIKNILYMLGSTFQQVRRKLFPFLVKISLVFSVHAQVEGQGMGLEKALPLHRLVRSIPSWIL